MKIKTDFIGENDPFEGDRIVLLQVLPFGSQIQSASATIIPKKNPVTNSFAENIVFDNENGDWGSTKTTGRSAEGSWVEVDFHARRTLHTVSGKVDISGTLQIDMGGAFVGIAEDGTFLIPSDGVAFPVGLSADHAVRLPGLTVTKFQVTNDAVLVVPDVKQVTILSHPTNVNLGLGQLPPFWTRLGEMTEGETTPDFADLLQSFLAEAEVVNGVYFVPIVVHSDAIARLDITLDIEFVRQLDVLPAGLSEVTMPFDFGSLPQQKEGLLNVTLPVGAKVIPKATTAKVIGAFDESRIVHGPTGILTGEGLVPVKQSVVQTQPIQLDNETPVTSIDLLIAAVSHTVTLDVNMLPDSDGKPFGESLWAQPITIKINRDKADSLSWINAALSNEFLFQSGLRYWLTVQVIEGEGVWGANPVKGRGLDMMSATGDPDKQKHINEFKAKKNKHTVLIVDVDTDTHKVWTIAMFNDEGEFVFKELVDNGINELAIELNKKEKDKDRIIKLATSYLGLTPVKPGELSLNSSDNGGLSWRVTTVDNVKSPIAGLFRLRNVPQSFQTPIEFQVGEGDLAKRVSLERFDSLGRVDFTIDFDEVADAFNEYMDEKSQVICPEAEHLTNGDFEEWTKVGNKVNEKSKRIDLNKSAQQLREPRVLAVSPDGQWAYVGSMENVTNSSTEPNLNRLYLQIVDIACDMLDEEIPLTVSSASEFAEVTAITVQRDGSLAYILTSRVKQPFTQFLHLVDLVKRRELGIVPLSGNLQEKVKSMVLTPEGRFLYLPEYFDMNVDGPVVNEGRLRVIDTMTLKQVIEDQSPDLDNATIVNVNMDFTGQVEEPTAVTMAPLGDILYVTTINKADSVNPDEGELHIVDTASLKVLATDAPILVGHEPRGIALTPDGKLAIVLDAADESVCIVNLLTRDTHNIPVGENPISVAISPDGSRAFIVNNEDDKVTVINIDQRTVEGLPISVGSSPIDVVITPQGDSAYVTNGNDHSLSKITIGNLLPDGWELTSGWIEPVCLSEPFHSAALLGRVQSETEPMSTSISQVVPVTPSCRYKFSFSGLSAQSGALAEIHWLGEDCDLIKTDKVPIAVMNEQSVPALTVTSSISFQRMVGQSQNVYHNVQIDSPEEATQTEIRFIVPSDNLAVIDEVSFAGTTESLANGDFRVHENGIPMNWQLSNDNMHGELLPVTDTGLKLLNAGIEPISLTQNFSVVAEKLYVLKVQGRTNVQTKAEKDPGIEIVWIKTDESIIGQPVTLAISPKTSDRYLIEGNVPAEASQAQLRINVPVGTNLEVDQVSFSIPETIDVPVAVISQTPGELTISHFNVAYEETKALRPPVPDQGLCKATPPGEKPGEVTNDCCFCPCCETERKMKEIIPVKTSVVQLAVAGSCSTCGATLMSFGGTLKTGTVTVHSPHRIIRPRMVRQGVKVESLSTDNRRLDAGIFLSHRKNGVSIGKKIVKEEEISGTSVKKEKLSLRLKEQEQLSILASTIVTLMSDPVISPLKNHKLEAILELSPDELYERQKR